MSTEAYLTELLDQKNAQLEELQDRYDELEGELERYKFAKWWMHSETKEDQALPVPRLELRLVKSSDDWYEREWYYNLVHSSYHGSTITVPFGHCRVTGGGFNIDHLVNEIPSRMGACVRKDMEELNLPAFIVNEKEITPIKLFEHQIIPKQPSVSVEITEETANNLAHCLKRTEDMWEYEKDFWVFDIRDIIKQYNMKK
jgi:hypothetical protein